ncbi:MAG: phosphoribosylaminoimidazolesuccinocarboxamide synthase, partial [Bacteroidales bacterium]|nr:phosphoribosylaminoimidazolesuccinocarboxamide synthase [Bacteroidales bacterium]
MEKLVFDGKEKQLFKTDDPQVLLLKYKDDTTAFDGIKRAVFAGKGELNCKISALIFKALEQNGIPTHYLGPAGEDSQLCRKCRIIPLYVIVRNYITGSTADLLGLEYGFKPRNVVYELRYDNIGLSKPLINDHHAVALKLVTYQELET